MEWIIWNVGASMRRENVPFFPLSLALAVFCFTPYPALILHTHKHTPKQVNNIITLQDAAYHIESIKS